ncbi:hypothetical protein K1719_021088 [Acacia pycnantha]|nr:hypothetical protein K1719_021088 [Acacia pycnantha]
MDPVGGIIWWHITKCLCICAKKEADYIYKLEENLESLRDKWEDLQSMKEELETIVDEAENTQGMQIAHKIKRWRGKVDNIHEEVKYIEVEGVKETQDRLSKCCPKNCKSSHKLGKKAAAVFNKVGNLAVEGKKYSENFKIAHRRPPKPIEMPLDEVVGLDLMFNKVWKSIEKENVGIIGLYGMGGVGKTTLLKKINNELGKRRLGFNFVIWVVVSKELNLDSIMDTIRKFIRIEDDIWTQCSNQDEKSAKIYRVLKEKKFVLLLDDIWDKLDLKLVGVPLPKDTNFQSKVLFTTRLENVCAKMQVQKKFRVEILTEKEASELFCMKVGEETLNSHPNIPRLAEKMAKECKGLPLALIVLGSSMAGVKNVEAWEDSIKNLTSSLLTKPDLEEKVFSILKYSYDKLDEVPKQCFLYCALYPEDYEILVSDLINKWMWEKFLCKDMTMCVQDIRRHGESVIEKLKLSCLLESFDDDFFTYRTVKMHDMIRDMALWLLPKDHDNMELVKRISITNDWESQKSIDLANVTTFVLLKEIQHQLEDIKYMKRLKVLELHVNEQEFVDIGGLTSLESLSFDTLHGLVGPEFWINLRSLTNLKFLSFQATLSDSYLSGLEIPLGVLSSLQQLRVFRLGKFFMSPLEEGRILEELECLPNIEELWITTQSRDSLNKLLESTKLQSCLYNLSSNCVNDPNEKPLLSLGCESMEEVIKEEEAIKDENVDSSLVFSSLVELILQDLPILKSIHRAPLLFPSLKSVVIDNCLGLEKLPFDFNLAKRKLTLIQGQQNWWDSLKWDDPTAKHKFQSKFKSYDDYSNIVRVCRSTYFPVPAS